MKQSTSFLLLSLVIMPLSGAALASSEPPLALAERPMPPPLPADAAVEIWISLGVKKTGLAMERIEAKLRESEGKIQAQSVYYAEPELAQELTFVLPRSRWDELVESMRVEGRVADQRMETSAAPPGDVNAEIEVKRALLSAYRRQLDSASFETLLTIGAEMSRLALEITELERQLSTRPKGGEALVHLTLNPEAEDPSLRTILHPGVHASYWFMGGPKGVESRPGLGLTLNFVRAFTIEADVSPRSLSDSPAIVLSAGGAAYSNRLGRGERLLLNPYLGMRAGYGLINSKHHLLFQADVGLELLSWRELVLELNARPTVDFGDSAVATGLQAGAGLVVPF